MKNVLPKTTIFVNANMGGVLTSRPVYVQYLDNISVQLVFTGNPSGRFQVQGSADHEADWLGNVIVEGTWVGMTLDPIPVASGSADTILIDINQISFPYIRVYYEFLSGSGILNGYVSGKAV